MPEQIRAELKLDLERQWTDLPWDTLAVLFRMKVETSVCFYSLRPQVIRCRCEGSDVFILFSSSRNSNHSAKKPVFSAAGEVYSIGFRQALHIENIFPL